MTATTVVGVLNFDKLKIFFPIRSLFGQRGITEANLDPADSPIFDQPGLDHIAQIFTSGN
jgi:hypothetical protein